MAVTWFGNLLDKIRPQRMEDGSWYYRITDGIPGWSKSLSYSDKLKLILSNPAALYIFLLLPELFSMGKYKLYRNDEEVERDPLLDLLRNPNPMQTAAQFKWDYMFNRKLGTANLYVHSRSATPANRLYFLQPDCIKWPDDLKKQKQKLFLSEQSHRDLLQSTLRYKTEHQDIPMKLDQLLQFFDISNGLGSWFESPSRVDALYKIVANSDMALKAKNINADFAGKFVVPGKVDMANTSQLPMSESDKKSVRDSMFSGEAVFPTKTMVDIKRFVENAGVLTALDQAYMTDAFLIGKTLNIPKDVIEMLGDSTYENQEKARAAIVSYCIDPDAEDFCDGVLRYFDYGPEYRLTIDFSHLPFVQVFEREKAEVMERKARAFTYLVSGGMNQQDACELLGWEPAQPFNTPVRLVGGDTQGQESNTKNLKAV